MALQGEKGLSDWRDVAADVNAVGAVFAMDQDVEEAAAAHFCPLLADEAGAGTGGDQLVAHHEAG